MIERKPALPPIVPKTNEDIIRVINLLGNRTKGNLTPKKQFELKSLIGVYPNQKNASEWKSTLKKMKNKQKESASD